MADARAGDRPDAAGDADTARPLRRRAPGRPSPAGRAALGGCAGVAIAALGLWAFHAAAVVDAGAAWERAWLLAIHRSWGPALMGTAGAVSTLGYPEVVIPVLLVLAAWFWLRRERWKEARLLGVTGGLAAVDYAGKPYFARPRPALFPHAFVAGASYPSGHALFAVGFYGAIASLLVVAAAGRGVRIAGLAAWAALALALGLSRLVLGVHWPTDVIAGYGAGGVVWACVWIAVPPDPRPAHPSAVRPARG